MINIVTANFNTYDFLGLLIESLYLFTQVPYEIIVVDNSSQRIQLQDPKVHQIFMPNNVGHGKGLNIGCQKAQELFPTNPYILIVDSDTHILGNNWDILLIEKMKEFDFIAGKGPPSKPIRPACMFMKQRVGISYDWCETEGYQGNRQTAGGYDVACKAYYKMMLDGLRMSFLESQKSKYKTINGEDWYLDNKALFYHHWSSSWLEERQKDFPDVDLTKDKEKLFSSVYWHLP